MIYATVLLGKRVKHLKKLENDSTSRFTQALTETLEAIQEVRAGNRQGYFLGRLGGRAREVRDYAVASQWKSDASSRASGLLFQFGIDVFRAAAMLTVLFSDLSIGQMLAVFSYLWFMIGPVEQLLSLQYAFYAAGGALTRINELLARQDEPQYVGQVDPFKGRDTVGIEVQGLTFAYGDEPVLDRLDLSIGPGEKVAIVGASGGGKSTLVQLLLGLYTAQAGTIRFGGSSLEEIGLDCVRDNVAVVLQHPALFNDTVRANLTMGRERSDEACWQALRIAQLADTIALLPQGLDSVVGRSAGRAQGGDPRRSHLGAGRRDRICSARSPGAVPRWAHHADHCPPPECGEAGRPRAGVRWRQHRRGWRPPAADRRGRAVRQAVRAPAAGLSRQGLWRGAASRFSWLQRNAAQPLLQVGDVD